MHILTPELVLAGTNDADRHSVMKNTLISTAGLHYLKSISSSPRRKLLQRRKYTIDCLWADQTCPKALDKHERPTGTLYKHSQLPMGNVHHGNRSFQAISRLIAQNGVSRNRSRLLNNLSFNGSFTNKPKQTDESKGRLSRKMGRSQLLRVGRTNLILYSGNILRGKADRRRETFNLGIASKLIEAIETIEAG